MARNSNSASTYKEHLLDFVNECVAMKLDGRVVAALLSKLRCWPLPTFKCARVPQQKAIVLSLQYHGALYGARVSDVINRVVSLYSHELNWIFPSGTAFRVVWRAPRRRIARELRELWRLDGAVEA